MKEKFPVDWAATPIFPALVLIGRTLSGRKLNPNVLVEIKDLEGCIPDHRMQLVHISGKSLDAKRGRYELTISGPRLTGKWSFRSGLLEDLAAKAAARTDQ
jgi:hypothetical protein